jgi:hypothetical protein
VGGGSAFLHAARRQSKNTLNQTAFLMLTPLLHPINDLGAHCPENTIPSFLEDAPYRSSIILLYHRRKKEHDTMPPPKSPGFFRRITRRPQKREARRIPPRLQQPKPVRCKINASRTGTAGAPPPGRISCVPLRAGRVSTSPPDARGDAIQD